LTEGYIDFIDSEVPIRILTVDDEASIVEEIVDSLTLQEIDATGLSSGDEALAVLEEDCQITVLMTDLDMPGINGLELAERALGKRSDEFALEVVLLTAHADLDAAIDAMRIGVFDLLRKPARLATLKDTLERAHRKAVGRRKRYRADSVAANGGTKGSDQANSGNAAGPSPVAPEGRAFQNGNGESFLSVISHELRTPLNPIIGFSQLIEQKSETLDENELKEYARYIREAGESLFELTESVLKVTELRSRPPKLVGDWVQSIDLLERLRDSQLKAAGIRYQSILIKCDADEALYTDADLLVEALSHLLSNAIAFSPVSSSIVLSAHILGAEMGFCVTDNGPGMTQDEIARAMQPFEQLDLRHTRSHGGLGVGLTLSMLLAECLRGRVNIESRPGFGTTASIWVPLSKPPIM
jgi:signal transduction histidine kinase